MKKILFVCTGNVFRSMSAEKCFNDYVKKNRINGWTTDSAGTFEATQDYIDPVVVEILSEFNIDTSSHQAKILTQELMENSDLVVAMAKSHQDFIEKTFWIKVPLFNEILKWESSSIDDQDDVVEDKIAQRDEAVIHMKKTVRYLHDAMPDFVGNLVEA